MFFKTREDNNLEQLYFEHIKIELIERSEDAKCLKLCAIIKILIKRTYEFADSWPQRLVLTVIRNYWHHVFII